MKLRIADGPNPGRQRMSLDAINTMLKYREVPVLGIADAIQRGEANNQAPVVTINDPGNIQFGESFMLSCFGFTQKPFNLKQLYHTICTLLNGPGES